MKDDYLRIRMSKRRMDKLRLYCSWKDLTLTNVIEDLIDSLPVPEREPVTESAHDSASIHLLPKVRSTQRDLLLLKSFLHFPYNNRCYQA